MQAEIVIPIVAILMPLALVPTVMVLRQSARKREWQHRERMKAIDLGIPVPGAEAWMGRSAIAIGAIMPIGVFAVAWLASMTTHHDEVWLAAALVSAAGVIGGARLGGHRSVVKHQQEGEHRLSAFTRANGKPSFNPEAYDAIARHT